MSENPAPAIRESPSSPGTASLPLAATTEWLLIGAGCLIHIFLLPHAVGGDGAWRYSALTRLLEQGLLRTGVREELRYSLWMPLASAPLYLLGRYFQEPLAWVARFNLMLCFAGLVILYRQLRGWIDAGTLRRALLLVLAASMFPNHLRAYYGEVFSTMLAAVGMTALVAGRGWVGGSLLAVSAANTPALLPSLLVVAVKHTFDTRRLRHLSPVVATAGLYVLESYIRRGSLLSSGYEGEAGFRTLMPYSGLPGFSYPLAFGLLSVLFSFGKGLLFFMPGAFLAPRAAPGPEASATRRLYMLAVLFLAAMVAVYSCWWSWYGGWFWGPRFFLFGSLLASFVLATRLAPAPEHATPASAALTLVALALSVLVGVSGAVFDQTGLELCFANGYALEALCWYVPEFSVLFHPFVAGPPLAVHQWGFIAFALAVLLYLGAPLAWVLARRMASAGRNLWGLLHQRWEW
ncbi:MAG TPA: hypothetical protein VLQ93_25080 [Myxococcaceae bacterium]|nr:hypothetical protein [Myxococcaceae bacterium]